MSKALEIEQAASMDCDLNEQWDNGKLGRDEQFVKAPRAQWLCPTEYPPPRGVKLQVLTWGGIGTEGHWDQKLYAAWLPMPNTPSHIKHRMMLWASGRKSELGIE